MMKPRDTLAGIRPGMTESQVLEQLGPPGPGGLGPSLDRVGDPLLASTSGRYYDRVLDRWLWQWAYFLPENNLAVELEASRETGPYVVRAVIAHGRGVRTDRGVEVGCSSADVQAAYRDVVLEQLDHPHESVFVLRSGDLLFRFSGDAAGTIVLGTPSDWSELTPATYPAPPRVMR
jgi:hypothetical protein